LQVVLIFIDGLGIGANDPAYNPCADSAFKILNNFLDEDYPKQIAYNGFAVPLDANLGVRGLPQSATGQTTLLTGKNASQLLGRHLPGFPNATLRSLIYQHSIMKKITANQKSAAFLNA